MCPVCTVTVIAGLGISRFFGIDDLLTSIWIGAFVLSFSFVFHNWMVKKWPKLKSKYSLYITIISMYILALVPLYKTPTLDRILYGTALGSVVFLLGVYADKYQRKRFKKIFFPYQKVVFPVVSLILASVVMYFVTT
jgi:hypothetical protein